MFQTTTFTSFNCALRLLLLIEPRASSRQSRSLGLGGSFSSCWRLGRLRGLSDGFLVLLLISLSDGFLVLEQVKRHEIMWRGLRPATSPDACKTPISSNF